MRWLLILLFILPVSYAADIDIYVERDGTVEINSDHPELLSGDQWTSKKGSYWVLNISTKETLQDYHFTAHLPPSKVNYIKTSKVITIEDDHGVVIEGKGEQKPFVLVVQYTLKPEPSTIWLPVGIVLGGSF